MWGHAVYEDAGSGGTTPDGNYSTLTSFGSSQGYPTMQLGGVNLRRRLGYLTVPSPGSFSVSGLGFRPDVVFFATGISDFGDNGVTNVARMGMGVCGPDLSQWGMAVETPWYYNQPGTGHWAEDCVIPWYGQGLAVTSLDADGFSYDVDFAFGTFPIGWMALKLYGANEVKVGAYSRATGTGWQTVTMPFDPTVVWLATGDRVTPSRTGAQPWVFGSGYLDAYGGKGWTWNAFTTKYDRTGVKSKGNLPERVEPGGTWDYAYSDLSGSDLRHYWYTSRSAWRIGYCAFHCEDVPDGSAPMVSHVTNGAPTALDTIPFPYNDYGYWGGADCGSTCGLAISPSENFEAGCYSGGTDSGVTTSVRSYTAGAKSSFSFNTHEIQLARTPPDERWFTRKILDVIRHRAPR